LERKSILMLNTIIFALFEWILEFKDKHLLWPKRESNESKRQEKKI